MGRAVRFHTACANVMAFCGCGEHLATLFRKESGDRCKMECTATNDLCLLPFASLRLSQSCRKTATLAQDLGHHLRLAAQC